MAEYRIICVVRGRDGNPEAVGYSENGSGVMYDDLWTLEQVQQAIGQGHRLYTVDPHTAQQSDLELVGDVLSDLSTKSNLDGLPDCG